MIWLGVIVFYVLPGLVLLEIARSFWIERRRDRIPILLYHRLISKADADAGRVADDEMIWVAYDTVFAAQMNYLRDSGYTTLDMDDYLAVRGGQLPRPNRPIVITFDDGYESNYRYAFPALRANQQKAIIFVAPEPDEHTRNQVEGVDSFLTDAQMKELADNGVSIQSHSLTHCILTTLDNQQALYELTESRDRLARVTGKPVEHIAIPRAGYNRRIRKLVRQAGYKSACCNNKGSSNGLSDPLALPRIVIERDMDVADFARALTPKSAAILRIVGNIKRIPERVGGAVFARKVRNLLYDSPVGPLFETRNLKKALAGLAVAYAAAMVIFTGWLIAK